jgi:hypothetical protein
MTKIGTWNLQNLFRPGPDSGSPSGPDDYAHKLAALARPITTLEPDVLAVQEVGDPDALRDLIGLLTGSWHSELADPDGRGIRVGFLSRLPMTDVEQIRAFPDGLGPVQVDDDGTTIAELGRPALRVRLQVDVDVDVISVHLKSKLLTFPGGRFNPRDEDERARYAVYALHRRAAEAAGIRSYVTALLDGQGPGRDHPDPPRAARLRDRNRRLRATRRHVLQTLAEPVERPCGANTSGIRRSGARNETASDPRFAGQRRFFGRADRI